MSWVLRIGLVASLTIVGVTLALYAVGHPSTSFGGLLSPNPALPFLDLGAFTSGLAHGNPVAYLTLGLVVLVATPLVRVASGLYFFRRAGERTLEAICLSVLALLLFGLLVLGPLVR